MHINPWTDTPSVGLYGTKCYKSEIMRFFDKIAEISGFKDTKNLTIDNEIETLRLSTSYTSYEFGNNNFKIRLDDINPLNFRRIAPKHEYKGFFV